MRNETLTIRPEGLKLEIRPVVLVDKKGKRIPHGTRLGKRLGSFDDTTANDPLAIWGVYQHVQGQGCFSITDCATKRGAEFVVELIKRLHKATGELPEFPVE